MSNKNFKELKNLFPKLFRDCYLYEIGAESGWYDLVYDLCVEIEKIAQEKGLTGENYPKVVQIKEKFGGLRYYLNGYDEDVYTAVDRTEAKSLTICEFCGKPAEVRSTSTGWLKCACDACLEERNRKMKENYINTMSNE